MPDVYLEAGGFPVVRTGEAPAQHPAGIAGGGRARCRDGQAPVTTSARRQAWLRWVLPTTSVP